MTTNIITITKDYTTTVFVPKATTFVYTISDLDAATPAVLDSKAGLELTMARLPTGYIFRPTTIDLSWIEWDAIRCAREHPYEVEQLTGTYYSSDIRMSAATVALKAKVLAETKLTVDEHVHYSDDEVATLVAGDHYKDYHNFPLLIISSEPITELDAIQLESCTHHEEDSSRVGLTTWSVIYKGHTVGVAVLQSKFGELSGDQMGLGVFALGLAFGTWDHKDVPNVPYPKLRSSPGSTTAW